VKTGSAHTLSEVARRLEVDIAEVRAAVREGIFPGRFLVQGEILIPAEDVEAAAQTWARPGRPCLEVEGEVVSEGPKGAGAEGAQLSEAVVRMLREEREAWLEGLTEPLERQEDRLHRLEMEVRELRSELRALGAGGRRASEGDAREAPSRGVDVRGLVREIADLESLLNDFEDSR
jgi:hypothetical protein